MKKQERAGIALTLDSVEVRTVSVPLRRPIVAKVGQFTHWPLILIDLRTREGVVGRSLLEPYVQKSCAAIASVIQNIAEAFKGRPIAPIDVYGDAMRTLHLNGREGITLIALSGMDMAIWDALARAAGLPLSSHLYPVVSAQLLRVSESADWLEWSDWAEPVLAEPFLAKDGFAHVTNAPGSGLAWDEAAVKKFAI